jgi:hypothetical protein
MKHSRRQELKTNELSIYLQQGYDFLVRNSTYVIGGVVVVVLIIVVGMLNLRSQHRGKVDAMNRVRAIQGETARDTKLLEEIEGLANDYASDPGLGPQILDLQASVAHQLALNLTSEADKPRRAELLKEAKSACERAIRDFSDQAVVVARARMTLAAIEETLVMDGQGDAQKIRQLYQDVINGPVTPYQKLASEQLADLDKRLVKLVVVPAPPAPMPLPTTKEAAAPSATATGPGPAAKPAVAPTEPAAAPKPAPTAEPPTPEPAATTKPAK